MSEVPARRRRVALFCTNFLPYSQSFVYEQLQHHERYEPEVFAWRRFCADRFPFEPVHLGALHYGLTRSSGKFRRRFAEAPFDVVHAHFGVGACYAVPYTRKHSLPLVATFHGYDVPLLTNRARWKPLNMPYAFRAKGMLEEMTLGLCASTELYDMLLDFGVPADKLVIHRLGIDLARFVPGEKDPGPPHVVMVGRFVEKKGFEYGIRGFAAAVDGGAREARLTLVGSGEREADLRAEVERLGIGDRVTFAGVLTQAEVAAMLQRAHVLLAPSVVGADGNRESGLIVVKEASACRTVPIGTIHGGIPEIIDHEETGFLVPERDAPALGECLARLLDDPELRERLADGARAKMEREYDNRVRSQALEALYDEAIEQRARRGR